MRSTLITATLLALSTATVSAASVTTFAGAKNADMSKIIIANLPTDGSDADLKALCTISVTDLQKAVLAALAET